MATASAGERARLQRSSSSAARCAWQSAINPIANRKPHLHRLAVVNVDDKRCARLQDFDAVHEVSQIKTLSCPGHVMPSSIIQDSRNLQRGEADSIVITDFKLRGVR